LAAAAHSQRAGADYLGRHRRTDRRLQPRDPDCQSTTR
jgi:hypothetical protein